MLLLNVWNLVWIGFWIISYKIDMHPKLGFTLLWHLFVVAPKPLETFRL